MIILPEQVTKAIDVLEKSGYDAYIVGECVRELLLGSDPQDYDIVTNAGINDILFAFRDYRISDEGMKRGEILVTVVGMIIQISPPRGGRQPRYLRGGSRDRSFPPWIHDERYGVQSALRAYRPVRRQSLAAPLSGGHRGGRKRGDRRTEGSGRP